VFYLPILIHQYVYSAENNAVRSTARIYLSGLTPLFYPLPVRLVQHLKSHWTAEAHGQKRPPDLKSNFMTPLRGNGNSQTALVAGEVANACIHKHLNRP